MNIKNFLFIIVFSFLFFSCSKEETKISTISEKNIELQILESYREGLEVLESGDALFAAKKFNEVEVMFPQSEWAPKSTLMAAYAYYSQQYYFDSIEELKIFIKKYPKHKNIDYAHYLMGIVYYEQIIDEKKDLNSIILAKKKFNYVNIFYLIIFKYNHVGRSVGRSSVGRPFVVRSVGDPMGPQIYDL